MSHEPRLTIALRALLQAQRVASLGTAGADGAPFVSMVPFAIVLSRGSLVIHVSGLAAHTRNLLDRPGVSILVMEREVPGEPVHALSRVTLEGAAVALPRDSAEWQTCRADYLARFPEAEPMTQLGDFMFVEIRPSGARQVAGFGAARSMDADEVRQALQLPA
jgi:putative heme iron utilization protein